MPWPTIRFSTAQCYSVDGITMTSSAICGNTIFLDNTNGAWEWNRDTHLWIPLAVTPDYVYRPTLAFDSNRNRMRLFGGSDTGDPFHYLDHTYEWDGLSWSLVGVGVGAPP